MRFFCLFFLNLFLFNSMAFSQEYIQEDCDVFFVQRDCFINEYSKLLLSESPSAQEEYYKLQKQLNELRLQSNATYLYFMMPIKEGKASIDGDIYGDFMLTIDGSEEIEPWGTVYENEVQFQEAWLGEVSAARSAWQEDDDVFWSVFAPVYNGNGETLAIIGLDYPVSELIAQYPEWNRDHENWNGFIDEIQGEMPFVIAEQVQALKDLILDYANQFNY